MQNRKQRLGKRRNQTERKNGHGRRRDGVWIDESCGCSQTHGAYKFSDSQPTPEQEGRAVVRTGEAQSDEWSRESDEYIAPAGGLLRRAPGGLSLDRFVVKSAGTTRVIRPPEIDWIESSRTCVDLPAGRKEVLCCCSRNDAPARLDLVQFLRIRRSAIVNIESMAQLEPISHGETEAVPKSGARPRISRTREIQPECRLGQSF